MQHCVALAAWQFVMHDCGCYSNRSISGTVLAHVCNHYQLLSLVVVTSCCHCLCHQLLPLSLSLVDVISHSKWWCETHHFVCLQRNDLLRKTADV